MARWFRSGLSVAGPFVCRCLTSPTMLRFHFPLIKPDVQISRIRLSDKDSWLSPSERCGGLSGSNRPNFLVQKVVRDIVYSPCRCAVVLPHNHRGAFSGTGGDNPIWPTHGSLVRSNSHQPDMIGLSMAYLFLGLLPAPLLGWSLRGFAASRLPEPLLFDGTLAHIRVSRP